MHAMFFGVKRVHLRLLDFSRLMLRDYGWLTPARFDMLRIVHVHDEQGIGVPQANIRLLLGVSAPTVSRMLKSLEDRGAIIRKRLERDARCRIVHFTERGRHLIRTAMKQLIDSEWIDLELDEATEPEEGNIDALSELLEFFRNAFQDPAPFKHPWRCGQLDRGWPWRFFNPPIPPFRL